MAQANVILQKVNLLRSSIGMTHPVRKIKAQKRRGRRHHHTRQTLEEENWEEEIKESSSLGEKGQREQSSPYDSEDVFCPDTVQEAPIHVQYYSLKEGIYIPAVHHVAPVKRVSQRTHVVVGQFADA